MNKSSKITASELVLSTIFFLQQKSGVTAKDITKFICEKRGCRQSQVRSEVKKALERATENGIFSKKRGLYRIESGFGRNKISIKVRGSGKSKKMRRVKQGSSTRTGEVVPCDHVSGSVYKASVLSTPSNLSQMKHFCSKGDRCRDTCVFMLGEGHLSSCMNVKRVSLERFKTRKVNPVDDEDDDDDEDFLEEDEDEDDDIDYFADDLFPNANDALKDYEEPEKPRTPEKPEKKKPAPKRKAQSRSKSRNKTRAKKRKVAKPKRKPCKRKRPPARRNNKRDKTLPDSEDSKPLSDIKTEQQEARDECELGGDSQQERMEEDELPAYEERQSLENENHTPVLSDNDYENETENDDYDYGPDYSDDQGNEDDFGGDDYGSGEDYQGQDEDPQENKNEVPDENKEESVKKVEEAHQKEKIPVGVTTKTERSSGLNSNDRPESRMSEDGKRTTVQQEQQTYKERPSKRNRSSSLFRSCRKNADSRVGCTTDRKQARSRM